LSVAENHKLYVHVEVRVHVNTHIVQLKLTHAGNDQDIVYDNIGLIELKNHTVVQLLLLD
jgi:hypothetical protein